MLFIQILSTPFRSSCFNFTISIKLQTATRSIYLDAAVSVKVEEVNTSETDLGK